MWITVFVSYHLVCYNLHECCYFEIGKSQTAQINELYIYIGIDCNTVKSIYLTVYPFFSRLICICTYLYSKRHMIMCVWNLNNLVFVLDWSYIFSYFCDIILFISMGRLSHKVPHFLY